MGNFGNVIRAGNTPPASEAAIPHRFFAIPSVGGFLRDDSSLSTLLGVPVTRVARSRSVGYDD